MLTLVEKLIFILAALVSLYFTLRAAIRIRKTILRGQGKPDWRLARKRLVSAAVKTITLQPTFKLRLGPSLLHALVAWGFIYYLLVNFGDVLEAFIPNFIFLGEGAFGSFYRLGADLFTVAAQAGMVALLARRFLFRSPALTTRRDVLLHPKARTGIKRDSAIVGAFILTHVGARFVGASFATASSGGDPYQPFASLASGLWSGWNENAILLGERAAFWLAAGTILGFLPYFLYSKHLHLFFAPLNFLLKPERRSMGALERLDFDDETVEQFGATRLEDLGWELVMDSYACIMCYRCQDACPAYHTGKVLSPAAMEINKRYLLNEEGERLSAGEASSQTLLEFAIPAQAVWACTACGACIEVCPVGNEPMRDIMDIRRALVLMENDFPSQLQAAFRGMERNTNPWNISPSERMAWADGLSVPTIDQAPNAEVLWWVGCAPATDARAQKTARAFAQILTAAGVNYAVLGQSEQCTGDSARRAGNEFLFNELAQANVALLNEVAPQLIVTTCPHCLHTLKNEYPAFDGHYDVIHHSQLIHKLLDEGKLILKSGTEAALSIFHDPCYLGRQNGVLNPHRQTLQNSTIHVVEMERFGMQSFCCGAGGAQMWKEEEHGTHRVSASRYTEATAAAEKSGAASLTVACPFCLLMLSDAAKESEHPIPVFDLAEMILERLEMN
jgi:Fe-S oxidoreductase